MVVWASIRSEAGRRGRRNSSNGERVLYNSKVSRIGGQTGGEELTWRIPDVICREWMCDAGGRKESLRRMPQLLK